MHFLFWRIKYCVLYSHFKVHGCALIQKFKGVRLAGWAFLMSATEFPNFGTTHFPKSRLQHQSLSGASL